MSWVIPAAAKSLQSCPTVCDPTHGSPPGSLVPGILQARTLEWVAISFSNAWTWKVKVKSLSRVRLFATPWTVAHQAPPSMGFSRQGNWSRVPSPSPARAHRHTINKKQTWQADSTSILSLSYLFWLLESHTSHTQPAHIPIYWNEIDALEQPPRETFLSWRSCRLLKQNSMNPHGFISPMDPDS